MLFRNTINKLSYILKSKEFRFNRKSLCGVELNVLDGTIREKVDQDDAWWFFLAKHHEVIFDIGCNIGYTALLALIQKPNRKMILVDPNSSALQKAALNLMENKIGYNVLYMPAFVGDKNDDTVKFYTIGTGAAGSMYASHAQTAASFNSYQQVQTITLDYLFDYYNITPDLVKIDVEGAETLVMASSKKLAKNSQCSFFIEMHNVENLGMEGAAQLIIDWCDEMRYKPWYLKTAEILTSAATIKNRGKCHLLLMPQEKEYPSYLRGINQNALLPNSI